MATVGVKELKDAVDWQFSVLTPLTRNINEGRKTHLHHFSYHFYQQESPADADKPARRESMPKIAPIRLENKLQTS